MLLLLHPSLSQPHLPDHLIPCLTPFYSHFIPGWIKRSKKEKSCGVRQFWFSDLHLSLFAPPLLPLLPPLPCTTIAPPPLLPLLLQEVGMGLSWGHPSLESPIQDLPCPLVSLFLKLTVSLQFEYHLSPPPFTGHILYHSGKPPLPLPLLPKSPTDLSLHRVNNLPTTHSRLQVLRLKRHGLFLLCENSS